LTGISYVASTSGPSTRRNPLKAKLYRETDIEDHWIAWSAKLGWVRFPAHRNGWAERKPAVESDALLLQEVPLAQAFNTDLMDAFHT
jgi:hypothetical protein